MSIVFGHNGALRDTRPILTQVSPEIYGLSYSSILQRVAKDVIYSPPENLDIATSMRFLDLQKGDVKPVRSLIESNNNKVYAVGIKNMVYTPQLYKIVNIIDGVRSQVNINAGLAQAIPYITMDYDAIAMFTNHNQCVLDNCTDIANSLPEDIQNLVKLCNAYKQYNNEAEPIIFIGYGAMCRLSEPFAGTGIGGYVYKDGMEYLERRFPNAMANVRIVNEYVLQSILDGVAKMPAGAKKFVTNDILLYNPEFARLYMGYEPNTITTYNLGDEIVTNHYFTTPSLQMVARDRAYRLTLA